MASNTQITTTIVKLTDEVAIALTASEKVPPVITSMADYTLATDAAAILKMRQKNIKTALDFFVGPLKDQVTEIKAQFEPLMSEVDALMEMVKQRMTVFMIAEQARKDEEQKKLEKAAMKANKGDSEVSVPVVNEIATQHGSLGSSTMRQYPRYRVTDISKVPKKYLSVDDELVKAAQKAGIKIPGVEYYFESKPAIRIG